MATKSVPVTRLTTGYQLVIPGPGRGMTTVDVVSNDCLTKDVLDAWRKAATTLVEPMATWCLTNIPQDGSHLVIVGAEPWALVYAENATVVVRVAS